LSYQLEVGSAKRWSRLTKQGALNGIAGVHLVAAELSIRGYAAAVTSRNTAGVDVFARSPDSGKTYSIQVKTNGQAQTPHFWLLSSDPVKPQPDFFYVFVNLKKAPKAHEFFVVRSKIVKRYSGKRKQDWNSFYRRNGIKYKDRWAALK
jgi:hypothetical protein